MIMKKKIKRFAAAALTCVLASALVSCGEKEDVKEISESVVQTSSEDEKKQAEETSEISSVSEKEEPAEPSATPASTPSPSPTPEPLAGLSGTEAGCVIDEEMINFDDLGAYFTSYEISDELFARIYGDDRSYKTYCTVPREDLRYLKVLHYGFDGRIYAGELMVNTLLADEVCEIFRILFENRYQREKMHLIDDYNADDNASIADNNTSAFNFRNVTGGTSLSNHAGGCAIDINPLNNPYIVYDENGQLSWSDPDVEKYLDRDAPDAYERHMINHDDLCYRLFAERGWTWGGDWDNPVDYQHFEKVVATY